MLAWILALGGVVAAPAPQEPQPIVGGEAAEPCAWPTTAGFSTGVLITGVSCAAGLIHPQVVLTYQECIQNILEPLELGDVFDGNAREFDMIALETVDACFAIPGSLMYACVLAEPVPDVPRTPPVAGCEAGILEIGTQVAIAGFGPDPRAASTPGQKRWAMAEIQGIGDRQFIAKSMDGATTCGNTDLGGPVYVEYPDGSWHIAGIVMTILGCEPEIEVQRIDHFLPSIEALLPGVVGIPEDVDITPCHASDGTWAPGEDCGGFSLAGPEGGGSWDTLCIDVPRAAPSATCGAAFGTDEEPSVRIVEPLDGAMLDAQAAIEVAFEANHSVEDIVLVVDGEEVGGDPLWPYGFDAVAFPEGTHVLAAVAHGVDGVTRVSDDVTIIVGQPGPDDGGSSSGGPGLGSTSASHDAATEPIESGSSGTSGSDATSDDDPGSCQCAAARAGSRRRFGGGPLLIVASAVCRRRRRRR